MSSEVGSAHISIFPVMTGFRSKVNKEVKSTGDEASNSFKSAFRNAGGISGRQLGKQLKESFAASSKGLADDASRSSPMTSRRDQRAEQGPHEAGR